MDALTAPARARSVWVLNLDAERELEGTGHTPSARTRARFPELTRALVGLLAPDDVILADEDPVRSAREANLVGRAWCPTPRALARLVRAGAVPAPSPPLDVLRRVNHRRFAASLAQPLPGACFVDDMDALLAVIHGASPTDRWLLKRPLAFAGRGRRRVARGALVDPDASWVRASFARGDGLQVEPWVERAGDFALHGFVARDGAFALGDPTRQECDETGAWKASARTDDLDAAELGALADSATRAARALVAAGYFGPFGVDAFRWRAGARVMWNPQCELNARYSMGWATGMGSRRPDLDP
jgi:hypothetical protein